MADPLGRGRKPSPEREIDGVMHKMCNDCEQMLPETEFYRRNGKMVLPCKKCRNDYFKEWRLRNRDKHNAYQREYKRRRGWVTTSRKDKGA